MILIIFKSRLWHGCFPMDFVKLLRTPFLEITSGRLLLSFVEVWPNVGLDAIVLQFVKISHPYFSRVFELGFGLLGFVMLFCSFYIGWGWDIGL